MQKLGKAYIKHDGKLLETNPGASIDVGGVTRTTLLGNNAVLGFSEQPKQAVVSCVIALGAQTSLSELRAIKDATITFECDTGQTFVVRNAWLVNPPVATDGDGGAIPLQFEGPEAEEMSA